MYVINISLGLKIQIVYTFQAITNKHSLCADVFCTVSSVLLVGAFLSSETDFAAENIEKWELFHGILES